MFIPPADTQRQVTATADPSTTQRTPFALIIGAVLASVGLLGTGLAGVLALSTYRQPGFGSFATPDERYTANSHALTLQRLDMLTDPGSPELGAALGQVTVRATAAPPDQQIFIGVASQSDVTQYLADVSHTELVDVKFSPFRPQYQQVGGFAEPTPPGRQTFWTSSAEGPGTQQIHIDLRQGSWALVVMNADGRPAVAAHIQAEVTLPWYATAARGTLIGGVALQMIGAALVLISAAQSARVRPDPVLQTFHTPTHS